MVKNLPANAGDAVQSLGLGWEDPLEKEMATHSSLGNPMDREVWWATVRGAAKESDTALQLKQQHVLINILLFIFWLFW